jgi:glycyl-tRNA synthetase beta chain
MADRPRARIVSATAEHADLLIELGCEELPPKSLDELRQALFNAITAGLERCGLGFRAKGSRDYSTPRRLAVLLRDVAARQPDQQQERRGPAVAAAFDAAGQPTAAALGFARSVGLDVADLERLETDKGAWLFARVHQPGQPLEALLFDVLEQAVRQLPVPRPMRWSDHEFSFVRPVHWLVVLHGERILDGELLGQTAGRSTRGHRVHAPGPHALAAVADYEDVLERACVIADPARRRNRIRSLLEAADSEVRVDDALLDEVNNLVEWPVAVSCSFDPEFLEVPHAALVASMQDHQKFFPVGDPGDPQRVTNRFVAISNIDSAHPPTVREGYERVIRPRLADARFFLEQDLKQPLDAWQSALDRVVFQQKIGTVGEKSKRIAAVSRKLADLLAMDAEACARAASLCKCDLMSQMVGEFPELQGLMGRHYALAAGEPPAVAVAIGEHYAPGFAGDAIPCTDAGRVVSIADRADTLVGIFAAGLRPSGNKDPFALRRAALGLLRILLEAGLELELDRVLALAANALSAQVPVAPELLVDVRDFVVERLRHYYREQGHGGELINAALASSWRSLPDLDRRLQALAGFMGEAAAASLAAANKRISNILRKADQAVSEKIDEDRINFGEERALFKEIVRLDDTIRPLLDRGDYASALRELAALKDPVDAFFDAVMVMDDDPVLRANRLALLNRLKSLFDRIADLSILG